MQIIEVHTKSRPSTVLCGAGAAEAASEYLRGALVFVVTDSNVARLYSEKIGKLFPGAPVCVIPAGERHKNRTGLFRILDGMLNARLHRSSVVVAFGGGVQRFVDRGQPFPGAGIQIFRFAHGHFVGAACQRGVGGGIEHRRMRGDHRGHDGKEGLLARQFAFFALRFGRFVACVIRKAAEDVPRTGKTGRQVVCGNAHDIVAREGPRTEQPQRRQKIAEGFAHLRFADDHLTVRDGKRWVDRKRREHQRLVIRIEGFQRFIFRTEFHRRKRRETEQLEQVAFEDDKLTPCRSELRFAGFLDLQRLVALPGAGIAFLGKPLHAVRRLRGRLDLLLAGAAQIFLHAHIVESRRCLQHNRLPRVVRRKRRRFLRVFGGIVQEPRGGHEDRPPQIAAPVGVVFRRLNRVFAVTQVVNRGGDLRQKGGESQLRVERADEFVEFGEPDVVVVGHRNAQTVIQRQRTRQKVLCAHFERVRKLQGLVFPRLRGIEGDASREQERTEDGDR